MKHVVVVLACSLVLAQAPVAYGAPQDDSAQKAWDDAMAKGIALEKQGSYAEALDVFLALRKKKPMSEVRYHVAFCMQNTGDLVAAREEYVRAVERAETDEAPYGAPVAAKAKARIAELDARIPTLVLRLPDDVVAAKATVDGGVPFSPLVTKIVRLDPGTHVIVVTAEGRKTFEKKVSVKEKDPPLEIEVPLPEGDAPKPLPVAETPPPKPAMPPRVESSSPWPWVVGGAGAVALATGGILFALCCSTIAEMDAACGPNRDRCPRTLQPTEDRGRTYGTAGAVFVGIGVVGVGAAIVLWSTHDDHPEKSSIALSPGPTPLGLGLSASF